MAYTLGEAAKATGKSKTSIRRALDSGRVSGLKNDLGEWEIQPAELHRVFPVAEQGNGNAAQETARSVTPSVTPLLQAKLDGADREISLLRQQLDREREISRGLETDRDHWRQQATALLTDQRKPERLPFRRRSLRKGVCPAHGRFYGAKGEAASSRICGAVRTV